MTRLRFLVDQEGADWPIGGAFDRAPQLQQVVQVPLQFFDAAADAGGAGDDAHALRHVRAGPWFRAVRRVFALDAARHAAAARIVRHQDQVAAGQRDKGRERRALVAALFLFDLDHEFLAFAQRILDACPPSVRAVPEIGAGDFLEGQEAVAVFAVLDEAASRDGSMRVMTPL